jgi:predicted esterase
MYPLLIALHGRNASKDTDLEHWQAACQRGWLVLSTQSTQPLFSGAYCWDDAALGLADLSSYYDEVSREYPIDPQRVLLAGFSQGSGMAIQAALSEKFGASGFIGVGTFIAEPDSLIPLVKQSPSVRGYFVIGEKDHTLDKVRAIQHILKENSIPFAEEVHPDLAHEFPADFGSSFEKAINFIFKEHE